MLKESQMFKNKITILAFYFISQTYLSQDLIAGETRPRQPQTSPENPHHDEYPHDALEKALSEKLNQLQRETTEKIQETLALSLHLKNALGALERRADVNERRLETHEQFLEEGDSKLENLKSKVESIAARQASLEAQVIGQNRSLLAAFRQLGIDPAQTQLAAPLERYFQPPHEPMAYLPQQIPQQRPATNIIEQSQSIYRPTPFPTRPQQ